MRTAVKESRAWRVLKWRQKAVIVVQSAEAEYCRSADAACCALSLRRVDTTQRRQGRPDYPLCRLYHGRGPPSQAPPRRSAAKFLPRSFDVWTFSVRLNGTTTKKVVNFFGKKSAPPQIRKSWLRVREKGPALGWYGAPEWLIRPWAAWQGRSHWGIRGCAPPAKSGCPRRFWRCSLKAGTYALTVFTARVHGWRLSQSHPWTGAVK